MRSSVLRLLKSPMIWMAIIGTLVVETGVVVSTYTVERSRLRAAERGVTNPNVGSVLPATQFSPFMVPGLQDPRTLPANASRLADTEPVIGVVVNGKPRAYSVQAMSYPPWHVVNDVIVGVPVSVTFCDQSDCTRVFTSGGSAKPLDVDVAGLYGHEMIVKVDGFLYFQESGKAFNQGASAGSLPYADFPWEPTTWKAWRQRHPDTDVFVGQRGKGPTH